MVPSKLPARLRRKARKFRCQFFPPIPQEQLFPSNVIVHFSYHKCLTVYYAKILKSLSKEFCFYHQHFSRRVREFEDKLLNIKGKGILSLNNRSDICFDQFPSYKGSHFIRDPRDLLISGYRYHLWTKEKWCIDPNFDWSSVVSHPYFEEYITNKEAEMPRNISYQAYLNQFDSERGKILELIRIQRVFNALKTWNFDNSNIIEKRYEDIIGNEVECFRDIFTHYGFHPKLIDRGLELADKNSLKKQVKGDTKHVRKGTSKQWIEEFTPLHKELFKQLNGELLIALGYENDQSW